MEESGRKNVELGVMNFSPETRTAALAALESTPLDILVIGGGVVGAGSALDAATRGLTVGIIEAQDWASGTSSRSSKLIHGGLRYLEMLDFRLVHEALIERGLLLKKLAPHLVKPVRFLYPLNKHWERPYVGAGVALYDTMARSSGNGAGLPLHRHLTKRGALREAPALKPSSLTGAVQYYDAQVDDARHTMIVVRTAAEYGALAANRTKVTGFIYDGERVAGVKATDLETGHQFEIKARVVINSTGVWTDDLETLAKAEQDIHVRASKGVHFLVAKDKIDLNTGLILRTEKSVLFVIPWGSHWIVGTTDTDWELSKAHPAASAKDIEYLLGHVNAVLKTPLTVDDIQGVYAGLRPLLKGDSNSTAKLSREHMVTEAKPGMIVIAGGKYTTYRVMGKDAVDEAVKILGSNVPASSTHDIPLLGANGYNADWAARHNLAKKWGLSVTNVEHLLNRYGSLTREIAELITDDATLAEPLTGTDEYLKAEVVYAVTHEGALHLDDVLVRRTRLSIETAHRGTESATEAATLMAPLLKWDAKQIKLEIDRYNERVQAERDAQAAPDDESANAARLQASEIAPL